MTMISSVMVATEENSWEYVGDPCPRSDLVLHRRWLSYVCLSGTENCTDSFCSGVGCLIGAFWVFSSWTIISACSYYFMEFSLELWP